MEEILENFNKIAQWDNDSLAREELLNAYEITRQAERSGAKTIDIAMDNVDTIHDECLLFPNHDVSTVGKVLKNKRKYIISGC